MFSVSQDTVQMQVASALVVAVVAAVVPAIHAARIRIVEGLRAIG